MTRENLFKGQGVKTTGDKHDAQGNKTGEQSFEVESALTKGCAEASLKAKGDILGGRLKKMNQSEPKNDLQEKINEIIHRLNNGKISIESSVDDLNFLINVVSKLSKDNYETSKYYQNLISGLNEKVDKNRELYQNARKYICTLDQRISYLNQIFDVAKDIKCVFPFSQNKRLNLIRTATQKNLDKLSKIHL